MKNREMKKLVLLAAIVGITGCGSSTTGTGGMTGTGGTGGSSANCQMVATSPGTWDITLNFAGGDPLEVTGLAVAQNGCTVTLSASDPQAGTITITGQLSNTGVWTAALTAPNFQYTANFSGTFSGGPPYTMLAIMSGSDSDGDTITGGFGEITL
jgi:hypothetical protein